MTSEPSSPVDKSQPKVKRVWTWLNLGLSFLLAIFGIWYLVREVSLADINKAFVTANSGYIVLSLLIVVAILGVKVWRWRLILSPFESDFPLSPLFWATMLGHYVNLVVPFLRLGEVARIYALNRHAGTDGIRALGTLVVEKTLNTIMLAINLLILLPLVALPNYISEPGTTLGIVTLIILSALYLLAYHTGFIVEITSKFTSRLPGVLAKPLSHIVVSGLEGLSALSDRRTSLILVIVSALLAIASILPPYLLLLAFNIELGFIEAAIINLVVTIAITPPSTPGKIGVFDGIVAFLLIRFGIDDEAIIVSYTVVYHLVVMLPQILLGSMATSRTKWRWKWIPQNLATTLNRN